VKCVICGRDFVNVQALRAHMKAHRKTKYKPVSVLVDVEKWKKFVEFCKAHDLTTCTMIDAYLTAITSIQPGIEAVFKVTTEGVSSETKVGTNPITINFTQHLHQTFGGPPRSRLKYPAFERVHEFSLECEVCGAAATALHVKRDWFGYTTVAVCEAHHREAERSFYGDAWIPLEKAEIRMSHMRHGGRGVS